MAANAPEVFRGEPDMQFTLRIPMDINDQAEFQNPDAVRSMAQAIERAGLDACYITDHPAPPAKWLQGGGHDALDPFAGLTFVAAVTTKLKLHTNLIVLPYRNPFMTAKSAATLDVLSAGRLILGVGVGYLRGEYEALGADFEGRGARMDEAIAVMKQAWSGEPVVAEGAAFKAAGILPRPLPIQRPHPPIWVGGNSERAMRRAVELCDGWSPFFVAGPMSKGVRTDEISSLEDFRAKIDRLRAMREAAGRETPFDICMAPQKGIEALTRSEADRWINDLGALAELGVTWSGCGVPQPSRAAFIDNLQWLAEEVLPTARAIRPRPN
jgi:probable F420-dependent oxidoreductase